MIRIIFKNFDRSEIVKAAVTERLEALVAKFPDLVGSPLHVTLEMRASLLRTGPDRFTVKVHVASGRYRGLMLSKTASNFYVALADVTEHLLEALNRFGDRHRVQARTQQREFVSTQIQLATANE